MQAGDCHHAHDEADARVDVAQQVRGLKQLRVVSGPVSAYNSRKVQASPMIRRRPVPSRCFEVNSQGTRDSRTVFGLPASVQRHEAANDKAGKDHQGCSGQRRAQHKPVHP